MEALPREVAQRLGCSPDDLRHLEIEKRSIDARGNRPPSYDLIVKAGLDAPLTRHVEGVTPWEPPYEEPLPIPDAATLRRRVVILGAGPCGLFAALGLASRGVACTVVDRGEAVDERAKSVSRFLGKGELNSESNFCYGEGGAGTFSDGKLYSRIDKAAVEQVIRIMVECGAPEDIAIDRRPHLGTDRLIRLLKGIRARLEAGGVTLLFGRRVERLEPHDASVTLHLDGGDTLDSDALVLCPGHSARALYRQLAELGVAMEPKPFAVGFRVEHPQALVNQAQYGRWAGLAELPAADYRLSHRRTRPEGDLEVFSFCMCPGGSVVPTATHEGEVCVNGMSHAARSGHYANSAVVTSLLPSELADGGDPLFAGVRFQERTEALAWELGGRDHTAPGSTVEDFLAGRASRELRRTTYRRGVAPTLLTSLYPDPVVGRLREGLRSFDRRLHGFVSADAVLIGVETRTSAPLRILRDDTMRSPTHPWLYPDGEGAGYAGGIASAAADGLRVAAAILAGR